MRQITPKQLFSPLVRISKLPMRQITGDGDTL